MDPHFREDKIRNYRLVKLSDVLILLRCKHHVKEAALFYGRLVNFGYGGGVTHYPVHKGLAHFKVGNLSAAEFQADFDLVLLFNEFLDVV